MDLEPSVVRPGRSVPLPSRSHPAPRRTHIGRRVRAALRWSAPSRVLSTLVTGRVRLRPRLAHAAIAMRCSSASVEINWRRTPLHCSADAVPLSQFSLLVYRHGCLSVSSRMICSPSRSTSRRVGLSNFEIRRRSGAVVVELRPWVTSPGQHAPLCPEHQGSSRGAQAPLCDESGHCDR